MALFQGEFYVEADYVDDGYVYNPPPETTTGPVGLPRAYDYEATKTVSNPREFTGQLTRQSALGTTRGVFGRAGAYVLEGHDTVVAVEIAARSGDAVFTEDPDDVNSSGFVSGTYSNNWFNASWFNSNWFNSLWFNAQDVATGNGIIVEDHDDFTGTLGSVFIAGDGSVQEDHDTVVATGAVGNNVAGVASIEEARDFRSIFGRVLIQGTSAVQEDRDSVVASGPVFTANLQLSWVAVGGMATIDIYRSTDGVNYTKIATVAGGTSSYIDENVQTFNDYYYYLRGTTTIGTPTQTSSVVFVDFIN